MKIAGIIFLCLAAVSLFGLLAAMGKGASNGIGPMLNALLVNSIIGGFLLFMANKRETEKKEREKWEKGDKNN